MESYEGFKQRLEREADEYVQRDDVAEERAERLNRESAEMARLVEEKKSSRAILEELLTNAEAKLDAEIKKPSSDNPSEVHTLEEVISGLAQSLDENRNELRDAQGRYDALIEKFTELRTKIGPEKIDKA